MLEVGEDAGPIFDAALSPCQSLLCALELAFCVMHALTLGLVEL
jgi:hypothetical protein